MQHSLSLYELELVTDPEVLLAKNRVIEKVFQMFGELSEDYKSELGSFSLPFDVSENAKISRGENYEGLPYLMLDYPRQFSKTDIFALRTFFWWGNFFSLTLQLQGKYLLLFADKLQKAIDEGLLNEWYITLSKDQWQHHFDTSYYLPIKKERDYNLAALPFIKVATKIPLVKWEEANTFLYNNFLQIIKMLFH